MGHYKQDEISKNEWQAELDGPVRESRESANKNLDAIMKALEKEERKAVIEYYISLFLLSLTSIGLGTIIGSVFL